MSFYFTSSGFDVEEMWCSPWGSDTSIGGLHPPFEYDAPSGLNFALIDKDTDFLISTSTGKFKLLLLNLRLFL